MGVGFVEVVKRDNRHEDNVTLFETRGCDLYSFLYRYAFHGLSTCNSANEQIQ